MTGNISILPVPGEPSKTRMQIDLDFVVPLGLAIKFIELIEEVVTSAKPKGEA